ncbi:DUF3788 family protein [Gemmatimonadota bacterium]
MAWKTRLEVMHASRIRTARTIPFANPFVDFPKPPEPEDIRNVLGPSAAAWDALITQITGHYGEVTQEWAIPAKKHGWSLRLKLKKRTILHLGPRSKHFIVAIILGKKAVTALRESDPPPEVIAMVENAREFTEGRVIRFEIRSKKEIGIVEALARIKMDH